MESGSEIDGRGSENCFIVLFYLYFLGVFQKGSWNSLTKGVIVLVFAQQATYTQNVWREAQSLCNQLMGISLVKAEFDCLCQGSILPGTH